MLYFKDDLTVVFLLTGYYLYYWFSRRHQLVVTLTKCQTHETSCTKGTDFQLCVQMNNRFIELSEVNHDPTFALTGVIVSVKCFLVSGQYTGAHICFTHLKKRSLISEAEMYSSANRQNWKFTKQQQGSNFLSSPSMSHKQAAHLQPVWFSSHPSHLTQLHSHHSFGQIHFCLSTVVSFLPEGT